ncbi:MAG: hypothetical protein EBZ48_12380, partial [Proteobacteria bacterium]|nr:hypothetical protein [Pseudomonadota bacterium]
MNQTGASSNPGSGSSNSSLSHLPPELTRHIKAPEVYDLRATLPPRHPVSLGVERANLSYSQRTSEYQRLVEIKRTLRFGVLEPGGTRTEPFKFHIAPGLSIPAESPGLEGFLFTEREIARIHGEERSAALVSDYLHYTKSLLKKLTGTHEQLRELSAIKNFDGSASERYRRFIGLLTTYVETLRSEVRTLDKARWSHHSRTYHLFARAFNHREHRAERGSSNARMTGRLFADFNVHDLGYFREGGFDTLRWMGVYPMGQLCAKGNAGGSPFAVKRYEVEPCHGTKQEVQRFAKMSARLGIRQMFELVLNHTAVDADLV